MQWLFRDPEFESINHIDIVRQSLFLTLNVWQIANIADIKRMGLSPIWVVAQL